MNINSPLSGVAEGADWLEKEICSILAKEAELIRDRRTGTASFEKTVMTETGDTVTWRFPLASGFSQLAALQKYRQRFGVEPPEWLDRRLPCHMRQLCDLAITQDRPLPDWNPEFILAFSGTSER